MKLSSFCNILRGLYTDRFTVYRHTYVSNADGTTGIQLPPTPIYIDVPCRVSFTSSDNPVGATEQSNPQSLQIKIFCDPNTTVLKGDKIVATKLDDNGATMTTYEGVANLPQQFITHKEILLVQEGDA